MISMKTSSTFSLCCRSAFSCSIRCISWIRTTEVTFSRRKHLLEKRPMPVIELTIKCIYGLKHRSSTNEYVYLRPHQKYARERVLIWESVLLLCSSAEKQKSLQGCNFPRKEGSRRQEERKERQARNTF